MIHKAPWVIRGKKKQWAASVLSRVRRPMGPTGLYSWLVRMLPRLLVPGRSKQTPCLIPVMEKAF